MDVCRYLYRRCVPAERGAFLWRYAVIIAVAAICCLVAFTTIGEEAVARIWELGERIAQA